MENVTSNIAFRGGQVSLTCLKYKTWVKAWCALQEKTGNNLHSVMIIMDIIRFPRKETQ